ncbi:cytochrome P450 family protein [Streptomyces winkii]|uniref:cytochrome P450 family protein n=1 Tax=Streptomyces winkii TaxID=3051178 RepID=UPI0028D905BC|nr:cytochrome P450 [Streptomyces sp. DSM 40971]
MTADQASPTSGVPTLELDPHGRDHQGEAARLRALGPVVRVKLPGDVEAWSITRHDLLNQLVLDPRISKDWHNWGAMQRGEIPDDWPLIGMVKVTNMVTADGAEHRRLRKLVSQTFTARRVEELRPRTTEIVEGLLDALPSHAEPDGTVDLRKHLAYPVPMQVISDLFGIPDHERPELREAVDKIFRSDLSPEVVGANQIAVYQLLARVVELRGRERGDDLTSALISAREAEPDALTQEELVGTLLVMLSAGHETTLSLIVNAVRALLTHPDQLALTKGEEDMWPAVVEETLRWEAPIGNFPFRYPTEDIEVAGVTIPAGDPIMAPYSAVGRDPQQHGPDADTFDISREQARHLAFGHGVHACLGAPLARLEGTIALRELFARYPDMILAAVPGTLDPVPSMFSNSVTTLPVRLGRPAG